MSDETRTKTDKTIKVQVPIRRNFEHFRFQDSGHFEKAFPQNLTKIEFLLIARNSAAHEYCIIRNMTETGANSYCSG